MSLLPANAGRQLRRWQASGGSRTQARGSCQAMRVRPTPGARGTLGCKQRLKVAGGRVANRPERIGRVDRAQPRRRASGVRCTPWLGRSFF